MDQAFKDRFAVSCESCSSSSYLVVHIPEGEKIIQFQIEMLKYNPVPERLQTDVRYKDGEALLYYDITSRIPLSLLLQRVKLTRQLFTDLMLQAADILAGCAVYLLEEDKFLLDKEFIYINPADNRISFIYIPVKQGFGDGNRLRWLASDLIEMIDGFCSKDESGFMESVSSYIKADGFSVKGFRNLLSGVREKPELIPQDSFVAPPDKKRRLDERKVFDENEGEKNEEKSSGMPVKAYVLIGLTQAAVLIAVLFSTAVLKTAGGGKIVDYAAIFLIAAAFDVLIVRHLLKRNKPAPVSPMESAKQSEPDTAGDIRAASVPEVSLITQTKEEAERKETPAVRMETALLSGKACEIPYLLGMNGDIPEDIHITGDDFVIGRLKGQADFISQNMAIGKLHARITHREGRYFLTDLNSKNGSFVNGNRLDGCLEYPIENGDRITLANRDYTFFCP